MRQKTTGHKMQLPDYSRRIWDEKYRFNGESLQETWERIARSLLVNELPERHEELYNEFLSVLVGFKFLPAGRIIAGLGTGRLVTLMNCFVSGTIADDMRGIYDKITEGALTLKQGGGIGFDFSTLRPKGALVESVGADASGPLPFMDSYDAMCRTIMSAGTRRGAMMGTMRCDHPDIEAFIEAKSDPRRLRMFNLSVLVTDAFMKAVELGIGWSLVFNGKVYKTLPARELWEKIIRSTYDNAEPGVIFIDRINALNNLRSIETIYATNPCGEQPLPPYGACLLGSVNLYKFVIDAFTPNAHFDYMELGSAVKTAVRMLDNVIDISNYPLPQYRDEEIAKRRIGLGVMGLAGAMMALGIRYGSDDSIKFTDDVFKKIQTEAYFASSDLAREKGPFPLFDKDMYHPNRNQMVSRLSMWTYIEERGLRNSLLTTVAPTGTTSLFARNVSGGIEPVFAYHYRRNVLNPDNSFREEIVFDASYLDYISCRADASGPLDLTAPLPGHFVTAEQLTIDEHLGVQAAAQRWVDSAISKTINVPTETPFNEFAEVYTKAYRLGLKGVATYRPNPESGRGAVLTALTAPEPAGGTVEPAGGTAPAPGGTAGGTVEPPRSGREKRPNVLPGRTHKIKMADMEHALYVTVNRNETGQPFEVFFNSRNPVHHQWQVALSLMISAVLRRGGDIAFVPYELKSVFDPNGGCWLNGRFVPSLVAAIGGILEEELADLPPPAEVEPPEPVQKPMGERCPKCGAPGLIRKEGCSSCPSCGHSSCG